MNGLRIVAAAGLGLSVVMLVLLGIGTRSQSMFVMWIVLLLVGLAVFGVARKVDENNRRRQRDEDFRNRAPQ